MVSERSVVSLTAMPIGTRRNNSGKTKNKVNSAHSGESFASFMDTSPLPSANTQPLKSSIEQSNHISGNFPGASFSSFASNSVLPPDAFPTSSALGNALGDKGTPSTPKRRASFSGLEARSTEAILQQNFRTENMRNSPRKTVMSASIKKYAFGMEDTRKKTPAFLQSTSTSARPLQEKTPTATEKAPLNNKQGNTNASFQEVTMGSNVTFTFNHALHQAATPNLAVISKVLENSSTPIRTINGGKHFLIGDVSLQEAFAEKGDDGARLKVQSISHRRKSSLPSSSTNHTNNILPFAEKTGENLGNLAAKFESGSEGIAAVGYDRVGGTSYGKFQISSRAGTMNGFISYLRDKAPDIAKRLSGIGPANTGSKYGTMPSIWQKIAQEIPERFEQLQNDFIKTSHFEPAAQNITSETGVPVEALPSALQEVIFSTAVQHGPSGAAKIVGRAVNKVNSAPLQNPFQASADAIVRAGQELIKEIYSIRAGQFGSSARHIQASAKNRLHLEMNEALAMFRG